MKLAEANKRLHIFLLASLAAVFVWSVVGCYDFVIWVLEAAPVVIGVAVLLGVYRRFKLTTLAYVLIWLHAIVLLVGAHYTYARMPVFNWIRDAFELSRNHYDRLGHIFQGFVPAIVAREVLLRKSPLKKGGWLFAIVLAFCLAISAVYELFEWLVVVISRDPTCSFLSTQGDKWDTQKDMALCLIGAVGALLILSRLHNRALSPYLESNK